MANAGFRFDFQIVDVPDFNGVGESEPNPYFYQVSVMWSFPHELLSIICVGEYIHITCRGVYSHYL